MAVDLIKYRRLEMSMPVTFLDSNPADPGPRPRSTSRPDADRHGMVGWVANASFRVATIEWSDGKFTTVDRLNGALAPYVDLYTQVARSTAKYHRARLRSNSLPALRRAFYLASLAY